MKCIPLVKFIQTFKGISFSVSKKLCLLLGFDYRIKIDSLNREDLERIDFMIRSRNIIVNKNLNFLIKKNINRNKNIKNYIGKRHSLGLPTRGQRTHSNSSTAQKLGVFRKS